MVLRIAEGIAATAPSLGHLPPAAAGAQSDLGPIIDAMGVSQCLLAFLTVGYYVNARGLKPKACAGIHYSLKAL
jgi:hypothetical protein